MMQTLIRAGETLRGLQGWRRQAAALAAGVGAALSMAPFYLFPLLFVSLPLLVWLLDGASTNVRPLRSAFFTGWSFGFGYFLAGLYWVSFSMLVDAAQFAWAIPFAISALPAGLALFTGGAAALAMRFWSRGAGRIVAFATAFAAFEYARGHILTGFPWNLTGQVWAGYIEPAQTAAFIGVYGLSFLTLLIAAAPAVAGDSAASQNRRRAAVLAPVIIVLALFGFGAFRLALSPTVFDETVRLRIVQPNIPQREKVNFDYWWRNLETHLKLSTTPAAQTPTHIIWPENAAAQIASVTEARRLLARDLQSGQTLILGAVRRGDAPDIFYNSLLMFSLSPETAEVRAAYDKHRLAPFGEYIPFAGALSRVGLKALSSFGGFTPGEGPAAITAPGAGVFAPLICYESIFPQTLYPGGARPDWLLNITNDAWFGDTSGPRQHLDQVRLRAIEQGLPVARSANTGISALIDPYGRYIGRIPLYEEGVIDGLLPRAAQPTAYARFGDLAFFFLWLAAAAFCVRRRFQG